MLSCHVVSKQSRNYYALRWSRVADLKMAFRELRALKTIVFLAIYKLLDWKVHMPTALDNYHICSIS